MPRPLASTVRALNRRRFLTLGSLGGALAGFPADAWAQRQSPAAQARAAADPAADRTVRLTGDGLGLTPAQYAHVVSAVIDRGLTADSYSVGGAVEALEARMATLLGKERAVFMPSGTLANHLAIRTLAGNRRRAVVQAESHIYLDSGDCVQTLSGITLMPLAPGRASFTAEHLTDLLDRGATGRVATPVGVVVIESPVRRLRGQVFEASERAAVIGLARQRGIRLHLDGARLFLEAAYAGRPVTDYTRDFDTVYVSLYKYFNAPFGAVLAGSKDLLDDMFHARRMFGAGLAEAWPAAAVAWHYAEGFVERYQRAVGVSRDFLRRIEQDDRFTLTTEPNGTNLTRLRVRASEPDAFRRRLLARGVALGAPGADGSFLVATNETMNRTTGAALADAFVGALG